jgi:hypothetical protein
MSEKKTWFLSVLLKKQNVNILLKSKQVSFQKFGNFYPQAMLLSITKNFIEGVISMDVYDLLHKDHERVRSLFQKLEETNEENIKERETLFENLRKELIAHSHAEQKLFYSKLKTQDLMDEGVHEHKEIETMLNKLDNLAIDSPEWNRKLLNLKEKVEHHVQEEEKEIFPRAKKTIPGNIAYDLVSQISQLEEQEKQILH